MVGLWWACDDVLCFAECIRDFEIRGLDWDDACLYVPGTLPGGPRLASRRRDHYHDKRFSTLKGFRRWPKPLPTSVRTNIPQGTVDTLRARRLRARRATATTRAPSTDSNRHYRLGRERYVAYGCRERQSRFNPAVAGERH